MDAETVARELYALPPGEFVAARNARAAEARGAGERGLADEIKAMRRPTAPAWVTNLLALEHGDRLQQLFSLGEALREAQTTLSADDLRRFGEQRRQVISALAGEAATLAAARGVEVAPQVIADVEQTLRAALADTEAAELVKAGRLTTALSYTGFGDLGSARSGPAPGPSRKRSGGGRRPAGDRPREAARAALAAAAERALKAATEASDRADRRLAEAEGRRDERTRSVAALEQELSEARSLLAEVEADVDGAADAVSAAAASLDEARAAAASARVEARDR